MADVAGLLVAAALVVAAPDAGVVEGPLLRNVKQNRGPDGNVAVQGVLRAKFCFTAPTSMCIPAGSTVFYTMSLGSSRSRQVPPQETIEAPPRLAVPVLRSVDASKPFEAFGFTWAAHKPTLPRPDEDAGSRVFSLEVFGNVAEGLLGADAKVGPFTVPKGSAVEVCTNGVLHRAKAPKGKAIARPADAATKPGASSNTVEIVAVRDGDDTGALATTPSSACTLPVKGWLAVEGGQLVMPPAPSP